MNLESLFIGLAVIVFLVMLLREVTVWYFKINEIVSLLKDIREELVSQRKSAPAPSAPSAPAPVVPFWVNQRD